MADIILQLEAITKALLPPAGNRRKITHQKWCRELDKMLAEKKKRKNTT